MKQIERKERLGERKKDQRRGTGIKCCQIKKVWKKGSKENEKEMYECEKRNRKKKQDFNSSNLVALPDLYFHCYLLLLSGFWVFLVF